LTLPLVSLTATSSQASYPLNSANDKPPVIFRAYRSCCARVTPAMAASATAPLSASARILVLRSNLPSVAL
jgi:hypothetical protein